jgi:hypothetical protein
MHAWIEIRLALLRQSGVAMLPLSAKNARCFWPLSRQAARLRKAARLMGEALRIETQPLTADTGETVLPLAAWQRLGIGRRGRGRYEEAVHRRQLGESFKAIGRAKP